MRIAPSRRITSPFKTSFSTMWRTSAAYSSGRPRRGGKGTCAPSDARTSSLIPCSIGVSKIPGAMVITRMPKRASSRAMGSVMPFTPAFEAAYAAWPICPSIEATDDVLTITPRSPPAKGGCTLILAAARRITLNVPVRLMRTARSNVASAWGPVFPTTRSPGATPAQLIAPWMAPKAEAQSSTAAWTWASSVTSVFTKRASAPAADQPAASFKSAMTTLPPASASMRAVAAPRPEPPPATRNTLLAIFMVPSGRGRKGADGNDRQVAGLGPGLPVRGALCGEAGLEAGTVQAGRHVQRLGERVREVRLERCHGDPAVFGGVEIVSGEPSAQERAGRGEAALARLRQPLGRLGERRVRSARRTAAIASHEERKRRGHHAFGACHVRVERARQRGRGEEARRCEVGEVVPGMLLLGRRMADDGNVAKARKALRELARSEAEPGERRGPLRGHQHVGVHQQGVHRGAALGGLQVDLPDVHAIVEVGIPLRVEALHRVARGRLDLDDGGAEVAQARARSGSGKVHRGSDDAEAREEAGAQA